MAKPIRVKYVINHEIYAKLYNGLVHAKINRIQFLDMPYAMKLSAIIAADARLGRFWPDGRVA